MLIALGPEGLSLLVALGTLPFRKAWKRKHASTCNFFGEPLVLRLSLSLPDSRSLRREARKAHTVLDITQGRLQKLSSR